jgi:hypothetical protein
MAVLNRRFRTRRGRRGCLAGTVDPAARGRLGHHPEVVSGWELAGRASCGRCTRGAPSGWRTAALTRGAAAPTGSAGRPGRPSGGHAAGWSLQAAATSGAAADGVGWEVLASRFLLRLRPGTDPLDRQQRQPEVADLGEQAVQGRLVDDRPSDQGLAGLVAADLEAVEPARPVAVVKQPGLAGAGRAPRSQVSRRQAMDRYGRTASLESGRRGGPWRRSSGHWRRRLQ